MGICGYEGTKTGKPCAIRVGTAGWCGTPGHPRKSSVDAEAASAAALAASFDRSEPPETYYADPTFKHSDPWRTITSDSPSPYPYDKRPHVEILADASKRLRSNGVALGHYWRRAGVRTRDGVRLTVDDDVSQAPTSLLGSLMPLHPNGVPKIGALGHMPLTIPDEVNGALEEAADEVLRSRHPNHPNFVRRADKQFRSDRFMFDSLNDWLVETGASDDVPAIVDLACERLLAVAEKHPPNRRYVKRASSAIGWQVSGSQEDDEHDSQHPTRGRAIEAAEQLLADEGGELVVMDANDEEQHRCVVYPPVSE